MLSKNEDLLYFLTPPAVTDDDCPSSFPRPKPPISFASSFSCFPREVYSYTTYKNKLAQQERHNLFFSTNKHSSTSVAGLAAQSSDLIKLQQLALEVEVLPCRGDALWTFYTHTLARRCPLSSNVQEGLTRANHGLEENRIKNIET